MGKGVQVKANEDGGVQEAIGGSRVDQRLNRDRRLARDKEMHQESEMARGGEREGRGGREECQPARLLLAGVGVFWLVSGGGSRSCGGGGIRVWEKIPGCWKGPLGGGITG